MHGTDQTNLNKFLEEILTPHICGSHGTTLRLSPQDVVVSRVMGITTADIPAPALERFFCAHRSMHTNRKPEAGGLRNRVQEASITVSTPGSPRRDRFNQTVLLQGRAVSPH